MPRTSREAEAIAAEATIEATEEAIINSLIAAKRMEGNGRTIEALPMDKVLPLLKKYGVTR